MRYVWDIDYLYTVILDRSHFQIYVKYYYLLENYIYSNFTSLIGEREQYLLIIYKHMQSKKRIFLKISWEALAGEKSDGIDQAALRKIARNILSLQKKYEIALMVWAGNIFRGRNQWQGIDPAIGHYAGMLATMVNALLLQNIIEQEGGQSSVFSSIEMPRFIKTINKVSALHHIKDWDIVICAWWSGNPFCTTDLWSVIRSLELDCDIMIKCTNVDGIYDKNPHTHDDAKRYETLTYNQALEQWLEVMDLSAFGMALENNLQTYVTHIDSLSELDFWPEKWTLVTV